MGDGRAYAFRGKERKRCDWVTPDGLAGTGADVGRHADCFVVTKTSMLLTSHSIRRVVYCYVCASAFAVMFITRTQCTPKAQQPNPALSACYVHHTDRQCLPKLSV
jgi:hypothetical protein